jgi:hypothetical protein
MFDKLLKYATIFSNAAGEFDIRKEKWWQEMDKELQEIFKNQRDTPAAPEEATKPPEKSHVRTKKPSKKEGWLTAKYDGRCAACDGKVIPGDRIYWTELDGAIHDTCYGRMKSYNKLLGR